jgi:hypothetical protein
MGGRGLFIRLSVQLWLCKATGTGTPGTLADFGPENGSVSHLMRKPNDGLVHADVPLYKVVLQHLDVPTPV